MPRGIEAKMTQILSDEEFIRAWVRGSGSPSAIAKMTGLSIRQVTRRRKKMADRDINLPTVAQTVGGQSVADKHGWNNAGRAYKQQNTHQIDHGHVIVFSDAHWWPDQDKTVAHLALLELVRALQPKIVVANGDLFDGARVTRHDPIGWSELPTVKQELDICDEYLHEIIMLADPKRCAFYWNVGNHDQRFDRMLVGQASQYEGVVDRLEDRFNEWEFAWSLVVNDQVVIKHRFNNGLHAAYNNTLRAGRSIVTGHLHRLLVTPWADYNGRRWGVDTGTLSDPLAPQFEYGENNPTPHTSGFAVLTFRDGKLTPPELCEVIDGTAWFRGEPIAS